MRNLGKKHSVLSSPPTLYNRVNFNYHLEDLKKPKLQYVDRIFDFLDCHTTLTQPHGKILSYGFPQGYYNNMDCTWLIQRSHGEVIEIMILHFDVQPDLILQICG